MPGSHLNDTERGLLKWWQSEQHQPFPTLRGLIIKGKLGLRGIKDLQVDFAYPITVFCGKNGSGKTTVISLAALGFHSPSGHYSRLATRGGLDRTYYTFGDFFYKGPTDPNITGVRITWLYSDHELVKLVKKSNKWMHYERRPERPVHYFGVSRSVPASELRVLRNHFNRYYSYFKPQPLSVAYRCRLEDIMGRKYTAANVVETHKHSLRSCTSSAAYSSFNMGAGEDIIIELLHRLERSPEGSLIVIEEIELGLHPEALVRLAKHLQEISLERNIQFVVSTHSEQFLDSVPKEARVLIERTPHHHVITPQPTTRYAMGTLTGNPKPELKIYCEDEFSRLLIFASLTNAIRKRVDIIPIGSAEQLFTQAEYHCKGEFKESLLIIWDGDYRTNAQKLLQKRLPMLTQERQKKVNWCFIPSNKPPERWVVDILNTIDGRKIFAEQITEDPHVAAEYLDDLQTMKDHHSISYRLSEQTHMGIAEAEALLARCIPRLSTSPLSPLRSAIERVLKGESVQETVSDARLLPSR